MVLGGAFTEGAVQVATTVAAAIVIALLIGMARFMLHVRDSVRDQDKVLAGIDKAVNHTPEGEPRLYDLVLETANKANEAVQQTRVLKGSVVAMQAQASRRDIEWNDIIIDLRGEVAKVQTTLESLTET
jgi:hypothetical protein